MEPHVKTVRAIARVYIDQFIIPIFIITAIVSSVALFISGWLAFTVNLWWLVLFVPLVMWSLILGFAWLVLQRALGKLSPGKMTSDDKKAVQEFVSGLNGVAEFAATPKIITGARIVYDAVFHRNTSYLSGTITSTKDLTTKYRLLVERFSSKTN